MKLNFFGHNYKRFSLALETLASDVRDGLLGYRYGYYPVLARSLSEQPQRYRGSNY